MSTIKPGDVMLTKSCRMVRVLASRDDGAVAMRDYRSRVAVRSVDTDRLSYHSEHELTLVQPPATPTMRDKPSPELMRALETLGKRPVQPPATPQEPTGSPAGYMESLMTRRKAVKLLDALAESCDRPDGEDHDWHECRSCVAAFSLTQPGAKALLRSLLAELTRASTPSPEGQTTWQPIETAPKDGTRVLLFHHLWQAASTGQFYGSRQGWKLDSTLPPFTMQPIRWRHLPSPPTPEGTQP